MYYFVQLISLNGNGVTDQFGIVDSDLKILFKDLDFKILVEQFVDKHGSENFVIGYGLRECTVKQDDHLYACGPADSQIADEFERTLGELEKKMQN